MFVILSQHTHTQKSSVCYRIARVCVCCIENGNACVFFLYLFQNLFFCVCSPRLLLTRQESSFFLGDVIHNKVPLSPFICFFKEGHKNRKKAYKKNSMEKNTRDSPLQDSRVLECDVMSLFFKNIKLSLKKKKFYFWFKKMQMKSWMIFWMFYLDSKKKSGPLNFPHYLVAFISGLFSKLLFG